MPRFCGVFGCTSKENKVKKSFFRLPAARKVIDPELTRLRRLKWLAAIRREDLTELKMKYLWICEDHFISGKPSDYRDITNPDWVPSVNMGYEKENSEDSLSEIFTETIEGADCLREKDRHKKRLLRTGLINASCPENVSSQELIDSFSPESESLLAEENPMKITNKQNRDTNLTLAKKKTALKENFTFKYLTKNLSLIEKPNYFWGISPHSNIIICARWNEEYTCIKKVLINNSLVVKAFLKELEINLSKLMNITCIDDVSNLLKKVESYNIT